MNPLSPNLRFLLLLILPVLLIGTGCETQPTSPPSPIQEIIPPKAPIQIPLEVTSAAPLVPEWKQVYGQNLYGVDVSDDGKTGWAVGDEGLVYKYNGKRLVRDREAMDLAEGNGLRAVWVSSDGSEAWIAGVGCLLHFIKGAWQFDSTALSGAPNELFNDIVMRSDGQTGFLVGSSGALLKYDGVQWKADTQGMSLLKESSITSLAMAEETGEVYALTWGSGILKYDGKKWDWVRKNEEGYLLPTNDIAISADGTVGYTIGFEGEMLKLHNGSWIRDSTYHRQRKMEMSAIWISPDGKDGWADGEGATLRWNGNKWREVDGSEAYSQSGQKVPWGTVKCIHMRPDGKIGWAVGKHGQFSRYAGGQWVDVPSPDVLPDPYAFSHILYSQDGRRLWFYGNRTISEYKNGRWIPEAINFPDSLGFAISKMWRSPDGERGWAIGTIRYTVDSPGRIFFYDGNSWQIDTTGSKLAPEGLNDLWMNSAGTKGWVTGANATLLRFNGTGWEVDSLPFLEKIPNWRAGTGTYLFAIAGSEDGQKAFVFGSHGIVLKYSDSQWKKDTQSMRVTGDDWITEISMNSRFNLGFSGSLSGNLYQYNGRFWDSWELDSDFKPNQVSALHITPSGNQGWLLSSNEILRWNGQQWEQDLSADYVMNQEFSFQEYEGPTALALHPNGKTGWAMDPYGDVFQLTEKAAPQQGSLSHLQFDPGTGMPASFQLHLKAPTHGIELGLYTSESDTMNLFSTADSLYSIQIAPPGQTVHVTFTPALSTLQPHLGNDLELRIKLRLHSSLELWQTYSSGKVNLRE